MAGTSPGPGSGVPPQRDINEIRRMFELLGLPICDDEAAIARQRDEKRARYTRLASNPDPLKQQEAKDFSKAASELQSKRSQLLQIVADHFEAQARLSVDALLASGVSTVPVELVDRLEDLARSACGVDDALARRFASEFMQRQGLQVGQKPRQPNPVSGLQAQSQLGQVTLTWKLPPDGCDAVDITREAFGSDQPVPVDRVTGTSYRDTTAPPGRHTYRLYSVHKGTCSSQPVSASGWCYGEPTAPRVDHEGGVIRVTWQPPEGAESVAVFRRVGAEPAVKQASGVPEPANRETTRVYVGGGTEYVDRQVESGTTHYRLVAIYPGAQATPGVVAQVAIIGPPAPPPKLTATPVDAGGQSALELSWSKPAERGALEFVVVRLDGNSAPTVIERKRVVYEGEATRFIDQQVAPGRPYSYAVFSRRGQLASTSAAMAAGVYVLAEVTEVVCDAGDGTVELTWQTPANVQAVVVRRSLDPPRDHRDGVAVDLVGKGRARDLDLRCGRMYEYLICCAYQLGGQLVHTPGVRLRAVPDALPEPVTNVTAEGVDGTVVIQWTATPRGRPVVVQSAQRLGLAPGHRCRADELTSLGQSHPPTQPTSFIDQTPDATRTWYTVVTVSGSHAVVGGAVHCAVCGDVSGLTASRQPDGVVLRWDWPTDCRAVLLARRDNTRPQGPADPAADQRRVTRTEYREEGARWLDLVDGPSRELYYTVFALNPTSAGTVEAPGISEGCRAHLRWRPWTRLRYLLEQAEGRGNRGKLIVRWNLQQPPDEFAGFVLRADEERPPTEPHDGLELFRWQPAGAAEGSKKAEIDLAAGPLRNSGGFFCTLFVSDPAQAANTVVTHPNICRVVRASGEVESPPRPKDLPTYRQGVPSELICPTCFERFPLEAMQFTGSSGEVQRAQRSVFARLRGQHLLPPRGSDGSFLETRLCPNNHELPPGFDWNHTLVLGLVGAASSGKSHYIASLVRHLREDTSRRLQLSMQDDSRTQQRFESEFNRPLFGDRQELPLTRGQPPPLIYKVQFSGELWDEAEPRSVTLSLYDTAGEELRDPARVQALVKYLRVASGLIFLVDPLQIAAVRDAMPPDLRMPNLDPLGDPNNVIKNVLDELQQGEPGRGTERLPIPVAVVLSKCDVLRDAGQFAPNRLWSTARQHRRGYDRELHHDVSGMIEAFVRRYSPEAHQTVANRFQRCAYFGVSATGCASINQQYPFIAPWRVDEPLLWLLSELEVIPKR